MKNCFGIWFLLSGLLVACTAPGRSLACGSDSGHHTTECRRPDNDKRSCCRPVATDHSAQDACHHPDASTGCPCDHNSGSCHCPGCGVASAGGAAFTVETPLPGAVISSRRVQKAAFYCSDHLPEAVYLPIWQPPRTPEPLFRV